MKKTNLVLAALILGAGSCFADVVTINLDAPSVSGQPGDILTVTLDGMFVTNVTPFFSGPPTVDPGSQTVDFGLLLVTVLTPYTDPVGPHTGTITILGGMEGPGGPRRQNILGFGGLYDKRSRGAPLCAAAIAALFLPFQWFRKTVKSGGQMRN